MRQPNPFAEYILNTLRESSVVHADRNPARWAGACVFAAFAVTLAIYSHQCGAQAYPVKPVQIVLSSPGGGTDIMTRLVAEHLTRVYAMQFVVESRQPSIAAANYVAKAKPDGYTLLVSTASFIVNPLLRKEAPYDAITDLVPVSLLGTTPIIVTVHPSLPVSNLADLIALARKAPGQLNYGSGGIGSPLHLAGELFNQIAGVKIAHIPFKGTVHAGIDLQAGRVQVMYPSAISLLPQIKAGRVKVLAVMRTRRAAELPNVPTTVEAGLPNLVVDIWYGLLAPKGTPRALVAEISRGAAGAFERAENRDRLLVAGVDPVGSSPAEFAAFVMAERTRWAKLIQSANISAAP